MASVTVDVDVDLCDVDDEDILRHVLEMGYAIYATPKIAGPKQDSVNRMLQRLKIEVDVSPSISDDLLAVRAEMLRGDYREALALLDRALFPKFGSIEDCRAKYALARAA
jgi:hypothetical protein